jgi:hypothetical protein
MQRLITVRAAASKTVPVRCGELSHLIEMRNLLVVASTFIAVRAWRVNGNPSTCRYLISVFIEKLF